MSKRGIVAAIAGAALAALVVVEAGQFAPYEEPRIAAAVGAFAPPESAKCYTQNGAEVECVKGQDVVVRAYRGLGGRFWGCGVDCIATSAARQCGVRTHVESHWGGDTVPASKRVAIIGASMGGDKAVEVAASIAPRKVDLLLTIDPVPWVDPKPNNVVDHINWHNTWPVGLGGGTPPGTIPTANIAVRMEHVMLINSQLVHDRAVKEICKLVTGGR